MAKDPKDKPKKEAKSKAAKSKKAKPPRCGLVMPIGEIDGCSEQHWSDVKKILEDAIEDAGFDPNLVSYADESGIIQERIITNLYDNPIVVCDVSGKNPNVMFELGMRLAFDKPAVVVKDDRTDYSFDTSPIEHLGYPRDLRHGTIVKFKKKLVKTIKHTDAAAKDDSYTTFLKHFGRIKVAQLETTELSKEDFIIQELAGIRRDMNKTLSTPNVVTEWTYVPSHQSNIVWDRPPLMTAVPLNDERKAQVIGDIHSAVSEFVKDAGTRDRREVTNAVTQIILSDGAVDPGEFGEFEDFCRFVREVIGNVLGLTD